MGDGDGPEHLEEVLAPVQLSTKLHPLQVVGDLLNIGYSWYGCEMVGDCLDKLLGKDTGGDRYPGYRRQVLGNLHDI